MSKESAFSDSNFFKAEPNNCAPASFNSSPFSFNPNFESPGILERDSVIKVAPFSDISVLEFKNWIIAKENY